MEIAYRTAGEGLQLYSRSDKKPIHGRPYESPLFTEELERVVYPTKEQVKVV